MNERGTIRDRTLILRILVPGLETRLRDKMKDMEDAAIASKTESSSYLDLEGVTCEPTAARNRTLWNFRCDGASYPAKLVNLPCPVELHKTHDHQAYYKSVDIAQMLIVYEDEMALEEAEEKPIEGFPTYYHSGLTPPIKRVVERRFAAREHRKVAPPRSAVADVEEDLLHLMEKITKDEKSKRNKMPSLTSANKVLEEVEEEVVEYERKYKRFWSILANDYVSLTNWHVSAWMDDFGRQPHGIEIEADDQQASLHPEVWLEPNVIQEIKEQESAKKKKSDRQKEKKEPKKGISSKKNTNTDVVDEVTQAATSMLTADNVDLMIEGDDFFADLGLDEDGINFDGFDL